MKIVKVANTRIDTLRNSRGKEDGFPLGDGSNKDGLSPRIVYIGKEMEDEGMLEECRDAGVRPMNPFVGTVSTRRVLAETSWFPRSHWSQVL